jgi:hypothetical protein
MGSTTHSIEVNAPLRMVYNQWTQFEEFPRFMEGVAEVRQEGPNRLFWKAKIAGKDKQWEAEITEQVPDKKIAWVSIDGTRNAGEVSFEPLELERTLITLTMEYQPEGLLEMAGDVLGIPAGQVEGDLNHFREFIEQTGKETGSWRGRIGGGETPDSTTIDVSHEGAQRVEDEDEGISAETSSKKSGLETAGMPARQDEPFTTREHASGMVGKPIPLAGERLGEQSEIASEAETERMPWTERMPSQLSDEPTRLSAERPGAQGGTESERILAERGVLFPPTEERNSDLLDKPAAVGTERTSEQGAPPADRDSAEVRVAGREEIARRAYEIYLERGQIPGHAEEDWLQAERELSGGFGKKVVHEPLGQTW